jgi:hypothetical protein
MTQGIHIIAERLWGIISIVALLAALYHIFDAGWDQGRSALIFPAIAGAWYLTRRTLRRKLNASEPHRKEGN